MFGRFVRQRLHTPPPTASIMATTTDTGRSFFEPLLEKADVRIDGDRPWDMRVHNEELFDRILGDGTLGLGDAYVEGWWDCDALDGFFERVLRARLDEHLPMRLKHVAHVLRAKMFNQQTRRKATVVAKKHYDIGNPFYAAMLDPYRQYSCGYFDGTDDLAEAQQQKLELIARKLDVQPGDRVLDIGCGWGGLAKYLAETRGCHVTGLNISDEQIAFAREFCAGLPVEIVKTDYRDMEGTFDKIVSVGMFEHVGHRNYATYMDTARRLLKDDGLFLLHSIGAPQGTGDDPWIREHIFLNSALPNQTAIADAFGPRFVLEDWHNFGAYYDKTLMAWHRNFAEAWPRFRAAYGDAFERMWRYYLLSCAGSFRARSIQLWQLVLSPHGVPGGYRSVR
jgi:cyclopropane-fatty-acyl-phospholipid synthase